MWDLTTNYMKGWIVLNNQKCHKCWYEHTCAGLSEEVRAVCKEFKKKKKNFEPYSSKWPEMSYYKEQRLAGRSMQERLRDGE